MMRRNVLLIGGTGFVGRHLETLLKKTSNTRTTGSETDIRDLQRVRRMVHDWMPDWVVVLAAITSVGESRANPDATYQTNFLGTVNILSALQENGFKGRLLYVSSSQVYGNVSADRLPLVESSALRPLSPYAASKIASEAVCYMFSQTCGYEVIIVRPFNHIGPGQSDRFAVSDFCKQVAEIKLGRRKPLMAVGDLTSTRDFTDVRDVANAYILALEKAKNGEIYNVCSNAEYSMQQVLNEIIELGGTSVQVEEAHARLRQTDLKRMRGSYEKLHADTGWRPVIGLSDTLVATLDWWVSTLK